MYNNNTYQRDSYKEYLQRIQNKVYESKFISNAGVPYYAYGLRLINRTSTGGLLKEDSMVCISMNHTKSYNVGEINNVVLNLIPMHILNSGEFKLIDYKYPNADVIIQSDKNAPFISEQYISRPIKEIKSFKIANEQIKLNVNTAFKDLTFNEFNVIRFEQFKEVYSRDISNPQLVVFSSIENAYAGIHSFTKIVNFDMNSKTYVYLNYQDQNRLEEIDKQDKYFSIDYYNQLVLNIFGPNNLSWEV